MNLQILKFLCSHFMLACIRSMKSLKQLQKASMCAHKPLYYEIHASAYVFYYLTIGFLVFIFPSSFYLLFLVRDYIWGYSKANTGFCVVELFEDPLTPKKKIRCTKFFLYKAFLDHARMRLTLVYYF